MLLHVDGVKYKIKPTDSEIGKLKVRFTQARTVKDLTAEQIAACLTAGRTVQPGVTPYSEETRKKGNKGTVKEDFTRQTLFMDDIDNKHTDIPLETPAHVAEVLAAHNLKAAFMYPTFNSTPENPRFRFALVSDEEFTDKDERDRVQAALIALFPQSDAGCTNADRMFFGTNQGLLDGYTDFEAVCRKADLLALADALNIPAQPDAEPKAPKAGKPGKAAAAKADGAKFGQTIPWALLTAMASPFPPSSAITTAANWAWAAITVISMTGSPSSEKAWKQRGRMWPGCLLRNRIQNLRQKRSPRNRMHRQISPRMKETTEPRMAAVRQNRMRRLSGIRSFPTSATATARRVSWVTSMPNPR